MTGDQDRYWRRRELEASEGANALCQVLSSRPISFSALVPRAVVTLGAPGLQRDPGRSVWGNLLQAPAPAVYTSVCYLDWIQETMEDNPAFALG